MHEKKDLVDDAFASVSSSLKKGMCPGAGLTYLAIHDALYEWLTKHIAELSQEEASGFRIFADSLTKPFLTICGNSGNQNAQYALGCIQNTNRAEHKNDSELKPWT
jgi:chaperonin GroEL (HSP60 family)